MDFYCNGKHYTAINVNNNNNNNVYEICDEEKNFIAEITISPFGELTSAIDKWIDQEHSNMEHTNS